MADGNIPALAGDPPGISEAALKKAEEFIEQEEGAAHRMKGWAAQLLLALAVGMSLFHLYAALEIVSAQVLRPQAASPRRTLRARRPCAGAW